MLDSKGVVASGIAAVLCTAIFSAAIQPCTTLLLRHVPTPPYFEAKSSFNSLPKLVLWAWERPEDFRFINPEDTAVAFLAATIQFHDAQTSVRPRFQPLRVPEKSKLIAVIRIESDATRAGRGNLRLTSANGGQPIPVQRALLNGSQLEESVATIFHAASLPRVVGVQVDFDAARSERSFYRDLLFELRRQLGPTMPISITALASWCFDDDWLGSLPIDEAVPMLFRMGAGRNETTMRLASRLDFREPLCRGSLGISTDEYWRALPSGRRLYVFNPQPWTRQAELGVLWETHSWH